MNTISFSSKNLNDGTIVTSNIEFEKSDRSLNIQSFSLRDGGKLLGEQFGINKITLKGYISGTSKQDLEQRIDDLKSELMNNFEGDLLIQYRSGVRRFICSCQSIKFDRRPFTIDKIDFSIVFVASDPPFGKDLVYSSVVNTGLIKSITTTISSESYQGNVVFGGTRPPYPNIIITFNSATNVSNISMQVTNANNFITTTSISSNFTTGDIIQINKDSGEVLKNGDSIDYSGGFPKYTLTGNNYVFTVTGQSFNIDIKFKYYKLWL